MSQKPLWFEGLEDALNEIVNVCGGPKRIASFLWPDKPVAEAARLLRHCLDPERPEKLAPSQIIYIMRMGRQADCHCAMEYIADELGYEPPRPVERESEQQRLQRQFIQSQEQMQRILLRMEKLNDSPSRGSVSSLRGAGQ